MPNPRVQTRSPGLLDINPVASPTDQFAAPEVRRQSGGNELAQLAQSLGGLEPRLAELYGISQDQQKQQDILRSGETVAKAQQANIHSFQDAVQKGLISETDNPWYLYHVHQLFSQQQADKASVDAWSAYASSPLRTDTSATTQTVSDFFNKSFQEATKHSDPVEAANMYQVFNQRLPSFLQDDADNRAHLKTKEMVGLVDDRARQIVDSSGFTSRLVGEASPGLPPSGDGSVPGLTSDPVGDAASQIPQSPPELTSVQARLQDLYNRQKQVMPGQDLEKQISESVRDSAIAAKDPEMAAHILGGIKSSDGTPLSDTADGKQAISAARYHAQHQLNEDVVMAKTRQEAVDKDQERAVMAAVLPQYQAAMESGGSLINVKIPITHNPAVDAAMMDFRHRMISQGAAEAGFKNTQEYQKAVETFGPDFLKGNLKPDQLFTFRQIILTTKGVDELNRYDEQTRHIQKDGWGNDAPADVLPTWKALYEGHMGVSELTPLMKNFREDTALQMMHAAVMNDAGKGLGSVGGPDLAEDHKTIDRLVTAKFVDDNGIYSLKDDKNNVELSRRVDVAQQTYTEDRFKLQQSDAYKAMSPSDKAASVQALLNKASVDSGGYDNAGFKASLKKITEPTTRPVQSVFAVPKDSPNPTLAKATQIDPLLGPITDDTLRVGKWIKTAPTVDKSSAPGPEPYIDLATSSKEKYGNLKGNPFSAFAPKSNVGDPLADFLRFNRYQTPDTQPDQPGELNVGGKTVQVLSVRRVLQEGSIKSFNKALVEMGTMRDVIQSHNYADEYHNLAASIQARESSGAYITTEEKNRFQTLDNLLSRYSEGQKLVGISPVDAKTMTGDAWKEFPMFANSLDLQRRGADVFSALGLSPEKLKEFKDSQEKLMKARPTWSIFE